MGFTEVLQSSAFVPEKSSEGEFKPLVGTYKAKFVVAEKVLSQKTNQEQLRVEFKIEETLAGDESHSQYNEFKKWLSLEGQEAADKKKGVAWIINALYTAEIDVVGETDEETLSKINDALGTVVYFKAWGWKPEDSEKSRQIFQVLKETVALARIEKKPF